MLACLSIHLWNNLHIVPGCVICTNSTCKDCKNASGGIFPRLPISLSVVMSLILWAGFPLKEMIKNKINQKQTSLDPRVLQIEYSRSEMDCPGLIPSISFFFFFFFFFCSQESPHCANF